MTAYLELGASLYVPATRAGLAAVGNREKYPRLRSVIFCTEDSVREADVPLALDNLAAALVRFEPASLPRFVRPRNPGVLRRVLAMPGVERLAGFVLPKFTADNLDDYFDELPEGAAFAVMPTLETPEAFDAGAMAVLRDRLSGCRYRRHVLALRIGGNDLLNLLGLRRPRDRTVYETPLGATIAQLVAAFRPHGFRLTAPVFEHLDRPDVLAQEVERDVLHGLCSKAAIHPEQVGVIQSRYAVGAEDLQAAVRILEGPRSGVYRLHGAMCEPATQRAWAAEIVERAGVYGASESPSLERCAR